MKTVLPLHINTVAEAMNFLTTLHNNGESYHPEDRAIDCISYLASEDECSKLDSLMDDIYNLDGNNGNHATPKFDPCQFLLELDPTYFMQND